MPKELNEDTLAALAAQGGDPNAAAKEAAAKEAEAKAQAAKDALPDITIGDPDGAKAKSDADALAAKAAGDAGKAGEDDSDLNKAVSKTLDEAGYNEETLTARLTKDGGISDEFITELKTKVDPAFVDAHVGRLRAELELAKVKESGRIDEVRAKEKATKDMNDHIFNVVGGKDKFDILGKTLKAELPADDLAVINAKLASGNKTIVDEGMELAVKKYNNIRGMGGKLMEGDAGQGTEAEEHVTKEEYRALIRTEKYKTDPKYARKVDADRLKTRAGDAAKHGHGSYYGFHPDKGRYAL